MATIASEPSSPRQTEAPAPISEWIQELLQQNQAVLAQSTAVLAQNQAILAQNQAILAQSTAVLAQNQAVLEALPQQQSICVPPRVEYATSDCLIAGREISRETHTRASYQATEQLSWAVEHSVLSHSAVVLPPANLLALVDAGAMLTARMPHRYVSDVEEFKAERTQRDFWLEAEPLEEDSTNRQGFTIMHALMCKELVEPVKALLESSRAVVDLTVRDYSGRTPLHLLCWDVYASRAAASTILSALITRLSDYDIPAHHTRVDWEWKDNKGRNVLSAAAAGGRLSLLWPLLRRLSYFDDHVFGALLLSAGAHVKDWELLRKRDKKCFTIAKSLQATASLRAQRDFSDEVKKWLPRGADVMDAQDPLLMIFLRYRSLSDIEMLLKTPTTIDFTRPLNSNSHNWVLTQLPPSAIRLMHLSSTPTVYRSAEACFERLLHLVLDHLEIHSGDQIDWEVNNLNGGLLDAAASCELLSTLLRVVLHERPVPYFTEHTEKWKLMRPVSQKDWDKIPAEDQERLQVSVRPHS